MTSEKQIKHYVVLAWHLMQVNVLLILDVVGMVTSAIIQQVCWCWLGMWCFIYFVSINKRQPNLLSPGLRNKTMFIYWECNFYFSKMLLINYGCVVASQNKCSHSPVLVFLFFKKIMNGGFYEIYVGDSGTTLLDELFIPVLFTPPNLCLIDSNIIIINNVILFLNTL